MAVPSDLPGGQSRVSVVPELSVRRGRAAIEFSKAAFGAAVDHQVGGSEDNEDVVAQRGTVRLLLIVDDPDAAVQRAVAAGATEVYPVGNEHGWRLGRIRDPFGHHWEIGKPLIPWPPARGSRGSS
jgi:PhnB protein